MYINNLLDDNSSNDVDHIVNKVNYIFIQAAKISSLGLALRFDLFLLLLKLVLNFTDIFAAYINI
jgi:hypothetical protein